jgi:3-methyladenine DNA glycosylase AlkD
MPDADEIVSELRRLGEPRRVAALGRAGVTSPAFGVALPALRSMAKRIGPNHQLALDLWRNAVREPRILASLIDIPERVTVTQMAGLVLAAVLAVHDEHLEDDIFVRLLPALITAADDGRAYVHKGASGALRQIGNRSDHLCTHVLAAVDPHIDSDSRASRWVAHDVARELRLRPARGEAGLTRSRRSRARSAP